MSKQDLFDRVEELLVQRGLASIVTVSQSHDQERGVVLLVPGDRVSRRAGKGQTSLRQLAYLRTILRKSLQVHLEWVITPDASREAIRASVETALRNRFDTAIQAVEISDLSGDQTQLWITVGRDAVEVPHEELVRDIVRELFDALGLPVPIVGVIGAEELPSDLAILRQLRIAAPVRLEGLAAVLQSGGDNLIDPTWLNHRLDVARRDGLIVRNKSGRYALTTKGLRSLAPGRGRASADVARVLWLARRKW